MPNAQRGKAIGDGAKVMPILDPDYCPDNRRNTIAYGYRWRREAGGAEHDDPRAFRLKQLVWRTLNVPVNDLCWVARRGRHEGVAAILQFSRIGSGFRPSRVASADGSR